MLRALTFILLTLFGLHTLPAQAAAEPAYLSFDLSAGAGHMHYFSSRAPGDGSPSQALIVQHGHSRDATQSFAAGLTTAPAGTLVIAPVFQVAANEAGRCPSPTLPAPQPGDALWTCSSYAAGAVAQTGAVTSFGALDQLLRELKRQWPSLQGITLAGFSAGGQTVQRYIGFASEPEGVTVRYAVMSPGTYLYFDAERPQPQVACPHANRWKYGVEGLPAELGAAEEARKRYAAANIIYIAGALDSDASKIAHVAILDQSCAAEAQGSYRLQRAQNYVAYDNARLAPDKHRVLVVVPGCGHDVSCVLPSQAARQALYP